MEQCSVENVSSCERAEGRSIDVSFGDGVDDIVTTRSSKEQLPAFMQEDEDELDDGDTIYPAAGSNHLSNVCFLRACLITHLADQFSNA